MRAPEGALEEVPTRVEGPLPPAAHWSAWQGPPRWEPQPEAEGLPLPESFAGAAGETPPPAPPAPPGTQPFQGIPGGAPRGGTQVFQPIRGAPLAPAAAGPDIAGMLGAAAAPVAVAVAVLAAVKALSAALDGAISSVGHFAAFMASGNADVSSNITAMGQGIKSTSENLFLVSPALSLLASAAGTAVAAFGELTSALDASAERYADFGSPELVTAEAMADVTQTLGDLRRAQQVGPALAGYVEERTKFQQDLEDIKATVIQELAPQATKLLEDVRLILPVLKVAADVLVGILDVVQVPIEDVKGIARAVGVIADKQDDKDNLELPGLSRDFPFMFPDEEKP